MIVGWWVERIEGEYQRLFVARGFRLNRVVLTEGEVAIVEGVPT
jgi:hypothetical protein